MNEFFQMGSPAAFALACLGFGLAASIWAITISRNLHRARELEHEEKMAAIPLDANVRLADVQGKWKSPASAKQIEARVEH